MPGDSESVVDLATAGGQLGIESFHADFELAMRRFLASRQHARALLGALPEQQSPVRLINSLWSSLGSLPRAAPSAAHAHAVARPLEIRRLDVDHGLVMSADSEQDVHPASARRMGSRQEMQLSPRGKSSGCVMRMCCKSNSVPYMGCGGY
jgi:hypothetical protein